MAASRKTKITLSKNREVTVHSGAKVQEALKEVMGDLNLYKGVKLATLLEALYDQGCKDGARKAFEEVTKGIASAQKVIPHRTPGRPKRVK